MTTPRGIAPIYRGSPYGVRALAYDTRDAGTFDRRRGRARLRSRVRPRRQPLQLARRRATAHAGSSRSPATVRRTRAGRWTSSAPYRATPAALGDMTADLVDGPPPRPYRPEDWPDPEHAAFDGPAACVRGAARRREHAAQALGARQMARAGGDARSARAASRLERRTRRGGRGRGDRSGAPPSLVRRHARPRADVASPQAGGAARVAGHRHRASRASGERARRSRCSGPARRSSAARESSGARARTGR